MQLVPLRLIRVRHNLEAIDAGNAFHEASTSLRRSPSPLRPTRARLPARARAVARDFGNLNNYYIKQVLPMILVTYNTTNTTNKRVQCHTLEYSTGIPNGIFFLDHGIWF